MAMSGAKRPKAATPPFTWEGATVTSPATHAGPALFLPSGPVVLPPGAVYQTAPANSATATAADNIYVSRLKPTTEEALLQSEGKQGGWISVIKFPVKLIKVYQFFIQI